MHYYRSNLHHHPRRKPVLSRCPLRCQAKPITTLHTIAVNRLSRKQICPTSSETPQRSPSHRPVPSFSSPPQPIPRRRLPPNGHALLRFRLIRRRPQGRAMCDPKKSLTIHMISTGSIRIHSQTGLLWHYTKKHCGRPKSSRWQRNQELRASLALLPRREVVEQGRMRLEVENCP
jgi:hypothetical protein